MDRRGYTSGANRGPIRNQGSSGKSRGSVSSYFSGSVLVKLKGYIERAVGLLPFDV